MNTFLPYSNYHEVVRCLDWRRLGKQRVECKQIVKALTGESSGWVNHPATRMWEGYTDNLILYALVMCKEWKRRGYEDNMYSWFASRLLVSRAKIAPPWMGDPRLHASHRSNLLRKDPIHYRQFNWSESDDIPYYWPY